MVAEGGLRHSSRVPRRRTDLASETMATQPAPVRWLYGLSSGVLKFVRVFFFVQAIGGVARIAIGIVKLDGVAVAVGVGQVALAGLVLSLNGGSGETVTEVSGPAGSFVIRSPRRRSWRDLKGVRRVVPFVWGGHTWRTTVRTRSEDPFGRGIWSGDCERQRTAIELSKRTATRIRNGEELPEVGSA